jgi:preprotein translocase subunit SecA
MIELFLKRIFGSKNERELKRLAPIVDRITALEPQLRRLSDAELQQYTPRFKERLSQGEDLEDLLPGRPPPGFWGCVPLTSRSSAAWFCIRAKLRK